VRVGDKASFVGCVWRRADSHTVSAHARCGKGIAKTRHCSECITRVSWLAQVEIHSVKLDAKQREDYDVLYQSLKRTVDR
jgi:hypothetical protein